MAENEVAVCLDYQKNILKRFIAEQGFLVQSDFGYQGSCKARKSLLKSSRGMEGFGETRGKNRGGGALLDEGLVKTGMGP